MNLASPLSVTQLSGSLNNAQLANSGLTVAAGTGLSGGGTVALGGSTTLNNAGVLSVGATAPLFSSGGANPVLSLVGNLDAATLGGLAASNFWQLGGNNVGPGQSLGTTNNQALEFVVNGLRALRLEPTTNNFNFSNAVNVINGSVVNFATPGIYGATIAGGGAASYLGFPYPNNVTANFGTVGGGLGNTSSGPFATVGGGFDNLATVYLATVSGGSANIASGADATVGGGFRNVATAANATAGGGNGNIANGNEATVGGGFYNTASGGGAVVAGGGSATFSLLQNTASGNLSVISGGLGNNATNWYSTIGGGYNNFVGGPGATIPGGSNNVAQGATSFAGGSRAQALQDGTFVWADAQSSPFASTGTNQFLIRAGGGVGIDTDITPESNLCVNTNTYLFSHAIYLRGETGSDHGHGLAYCGPEVTNFAPTVLPDGPVLWGHSGGVLGVVNGGANAVLSWNNAGVTINGGFTYSSDRNIKSSFAFLKPQDILARVTALPLTSWVYTNDSAARHIGPMAQDFHAAFQMNGADDTHINVGDETGVALAAIQGLNEKLEAQLNQKEVELQELKTRNTGLEERLQRIEQLIEKK
jgi:hypothetical protein